MGRKMIQRNLINNAIHAYFAAIEIHNKPKIEYRYETTSVLIINAWELILKAFVRKNIKGKSIFKAKNQQKTGIEKETLPLKVIISYCLEYLNSIDQSNFFKATAENILKIEEYRDKSIHFYNEKIEPIIFSLIAKSSYDFIKFLKEYFNKDIIEDERMYIMPIGFKLPFNPIKFFTNEYAEMTNSEECKQFIKSTINCIEALKNHGIEDSIVVGFDVKVDSVRNIKNSDFLVAIDNENGKEIKVTKKRKVILSDDKGAQRVSISPEEFYKIYKYTYTTVRSMYKDRCPDFKADRKFVDIMQKAKSNPIYAGTLGKHPQSKSKANPSYSYTERIFELLDSEYNKGEN